MLEAFVKSTSKLIVRQRANERIRAVRQLLAHRGTDSMFYSGVSACVLSAGRLLSGWDTEAADGEREREELPPEFRLSKETVRR
jgi:hypothetical protein